MLVLFYPELCTGMCEDLILVSGVDAQRITEEWEYELPHDIYDTQELFNAEDETKKDDQGLL